ncbi:MAG: leucine-rich repeat domain-containing protein, partial [Ureaplasma sp.]|nr:leucine-rich repeat domain-containing protein [Ureaplasma sp.]
ASDNITQNNIDSYLSNEIYDLVKNVKTINNQKLSEFVATPTFKNNSINISLKDNIGLYKFKKDSLASISISWNEIILSDIQLSVPKESPENWFTWNSTKITGLSNIGLNQKRIVLPSKVTAIENNVFWRNETIVSVDLSLTKITELPGGGPVYDGVSGSLLSYLGIFADCINLISISLPPSLTLIGSNTFYTCTSLTSITIPDSVTLIQWQVFQGCSSLTSITIPKSVTSIGNYAFYNCANLTSINIPDGVASIGQSTFSGCTSLTSITIPNSVTLIGNYAFHSCSSLSSITMPNSVTSIGANALANISPTCVMSVSSGWDQTLATNAGYQGKFNVID